MAAQAQDRPSAAAASPRVLGDIPGHFARRQPDNVALSFEGRTTTYAALERQTSQVARALLASGAGPGDRICYLGKNTDLYFELLLGAAKAGVTMVPINWRLAPPEVAYIARNAEARLLFSTREFLDTARALSRELAGITLIPLENAGPGEPAYAAWRDAHGPGPVDHAAQPSDIVIQLYTSGTTGHPKGAMLSHGNLLVPLAALAEAGIEWNRWGPSDIGLVAMPVAHISGTGWGLVGLYNGSKSVVTREFDPHAVLDFIENEKITKLFMVPSAMQIVLSDPRARTVDYSRLRYILYGASPIPPPLLREGMEVFGCGFVQNYGMTETAGSVTALVPEDHSLEDVPRMKSAGKPLPGVEIAILDPQGRPLPPGQSGEIATRSPANMAGYWRMPEATAAALTPDGWLRTGDAGYLDEDGYLYIHDRIKDMIISGGENVYPAEVEKVLSDHPQIAEVAVIGVPHPKWGEAVKAVVVPRPGAGIDPAEIIAWARPRIAGYKLPKSVDVVASLPRNASGKILRRELRAPYWEEQIRPIN